jgi:predicted TIM-barrel fold metal-dependent hydrolase
MSKPGDLHQAGLAGSALAGEVVIDAHMHIDKFYNFLIPRSEANYVVASAERIGIQTMYGSSIVALRGDAELGNKNALAFHAKYPRLFFPYIVFKPNYPEDADLTIALAETEKIRQFKIHDDGNDLPYDDKRYLPLYDYANRTGGIILAHTYGKKHVVPMMKVAEEFPHVRILLGHSGIFEEEIYAQAVRKHDNIYLETCSSFAWYGLIERLVAMAGPERVLFGTDMPFMSPDQQLGRVLFARISDEDKRKVLGLNAQRLFA